MRNTPQEALADLGGWQDAQIRELSGGTNNHTWLVESGERRAVLKIDDAPRSAPFNSRKDEARLQSLAAEQGLANTVIFASETVYLSEYVDGDVWKRSCLDKPGNLEALAAALKRLHSLPLTGRTFDAPGAARLYAQRINGETAKVMECLDAIESMPRPANLCCCHNDLVVENIITTPDVRFLDWEYACDNDPFFDLATIAAHHNLSDEQCDSLLDAYFNGSGERWREQLAKYQRFYSALLWLWTAARVT